jgi:aminoacrylate hydrolase
MTPVLSSDLGLHVERDGEGFPVILISGLNGLARYWADQVPFLADSFQVITHDQRGIGGSDRTEGHCTIEQMAADVIAMMDALGVPRAHIVGHSSGSAIAQLLAIRHPRRVAALVIVSGWPKPDPYFRRYFLLRRKILEELGPQAYIEANSLSVFPSWWIAANDAALAVQEAQYAATFPKLETMLRRIDAILGFDYAAELGRIKAPTLIMAADDDIVVPCYCGEGLSRAIPGAELKLFPSGGHCFNRVVPREFNHALLPFLTANTPGR